MSLTGSFRKSKIGANEIKVMINLQKVRVSGGNVSAMAFAETQLPPQIIMEMTMKKTNKKVLFEVFISPFHLTVIGKLS